MIKIIRMNDILSILRHLAPSSLLHSRDRTGGITFGDFMEFLSVITKGTTEDKLQWAFTFYDVNHDGVISREELIRVSLAKSRMQIADGPIGLFIRMKTIP